MPKNSTNLPVHKCIQANVTATALKITCLLPEACYSKSIALGLSTGWNFKAKTCLNAADQPAVMRGRWQGHWGCEVDLGRCCSLWLPALFLCLVGPSGGQKRDCLLSQEETIHFRVRSLAVICYAPFTTSAISRLFHHRVLYEWDRYKLPST